MTAGRAFALLFVLAFYGVGYVATDGPIYYAAGLVILTGFALIAYGVTRPARR